MSNDSQGFDWPTGKWIAGGLVAIAAVVGLVVLLNVIGSDNPVPETPDVDQMEWSIVLSDLTGVEVTLKGDEPLGFPTETWQDDFLVEREVQATFEWDVDVELPQAVVDIDQAADCAALQAHLNEWAVAVGQAPLEGRKLQAEAFAQHAVNTMRAQGCEIDLSILER